ncbi:hypothetical protein AB0I39_07605 [Kitasatospora purpeofusca]|uniref:hypothetical protein n=1 Tax=Kitasatospora purpeofusca TaxID=67352 RepID=UPI0033DBF362
MTNLEIHAADGPRPRRVLGRACPQCGDRLAMTWEQQQALTLLTRGASMREIARELQFTGRTAARSVDTLIYRALGYLGATTRVQGVDIAYRVMLLPAPAGSGRLSRSLTAEEVRITGCLVDGHTVTGAAELLGITRARARGVLGRLADDLEAPGGSGRTAMTVHRMHRSGLLSDSHPCPCRSGPSAPAAARWVRGLRCPACAVRPVVATEEHTVLGLIGAGLSDEEIGTKFASTREGGTHRVRSTLRALGAATRAQAVDIGCRTGLVVPRKRPRAAGRLIRAVDLEPVHAVIRGLRLTALAGHGIEASHLALKHRMNQLYARIGANTARSPVGLAVSILHSLDALPRTHPCQCATSVVPLTEAAAADTRRLARQGLIRA